jgi:hypothetical protein
MPLKSIHLSGEILLKLTWMGLLLPFELVVRFEGCFCEPADLEPLCLGRLVRLFVAAVFNFANLILSLVMQA